MLEARYRWNTTKNSILQQKFENFAKYLLDACTFDLTVFILSQWTQHLTLLPCVFCDKFIDRQKHFLYLMKVLIVLIS